MMDVRATADPPATGFAGLASLVSTVPDSEPEPLPAIAPPPPAMPRWAWVFVGMAVVGVLRFLAGPVPHPAPTVPTPYLTQPNLFPQTIPIPGFAPPLPRPQSSLPTTRAAPSLAPALPSGQPPSISEVKPPPGTDLTLSASQILYCLAQKIRLDVMEPMVDTKSAAQLSGFNGLVDDYNLRCLSYRYRAADMAAARRLVELTRAILATEATSQVGAWKYGVSPSSGITR